MKSAEKNAQKIKEKYGDKALDFCDDALDILIEYNNSIKKLRDESEPEALMFEKRLELWIETKKELQNE